MKLATMLDCGPVTKDRAGFDFDGGDHLFRIAQMQRERRFGLAPQLAVTGHIALVDRVFNHQHVAHGVEALPMGRNSATVL